MGTSAQPSARHCVTCGKEISNDANVCQYCGHDYRAPAGPAPVKKTIVPIIGGICIMISALIIIFWGLALVGTGGVFDDLAMYDLEEIEGFSDLLTACGGILIILGLIGLLGGIFGIMRKHFGLVIVGGILVLPGAGLPALLGLILVAISKKEFE